MNKILIIIVVAAVVLTGIIFVPELAHSCDSCDKFFIGTGYKPNILAGFLGKDDDIICKDCAEQQHALANSLGGSLDDFKRKLFD